MPDAPAALDELLARVRPEVAALVTAADDLVHRVDPAAVRVVWPHQRTVGWGIGPRKMSDHYAYLTAHERHVNLGCNHGARLDDGGLLGGTGRSMRSTAVRSVDDLADPRWPAVLDAARRERLSALGRG